MNTSTHTRSSVHPRDTGSRGFGAGTSTSNKNTRQRAEDDDRALIQEWGQKERDINAVLISAIAITLSVAWHIISNIRHLEATHQLVYFQGLYTAVRVAMSQRASPVTIPQAPVPSMLSQPYPTFESSESSLRVIRMNMYWLTTLVFNISTVSLAMFARQRTRDVKLRLIRRLRLRNASKNDTMEVPIDESAQSFFMVMGMDTMYRLFQVALIVFLLGHIDAIVKPIGVTFLGSVVICGMLYIFRAIGLN